MPKMKTHSGAKKRYKVTGSGKILRRNSNLNLVGTGKCRNAQGGGKREGSGKFQHRWLLADGG